VRKKDLLEDYRWTLKFKSWDSTDVKTYPFALAGHGEPLNSFKDCANRCHAMVSAYRTRHSEHRFQLECGHLSTYIDTLKMYTQGSERIMLQDSHISGTVYWFRKIILVIHHHIDSGEDHLHGFMNLLASTGCGSQTPIQRQPSHRPGQFQDLIIYAYKKLPSQAFVKRSI